MDAEDQRGPWEYIWYHVVQAFGEDRKLLGVVGKTNESGVWQGRRIGSRAPVGS